MEQCVVVANEISDCANVYALGGAKLYVQLFRERQWVVLFLEGWRYSHSFLEQPSNQASKTPAFLSALHENAAAKMRGEKHHLTLSINQPPLPSLFESSILTVST